MFWLKRNPFFYLTLGLLLVVAIGGMLYTSKDADRLEQLKDQYESKDKQLQLFLSRSPAPTNANLAVLDRNYEQLMEEFKKSQASLNLSTFDRDLFFGKPPSNSNDAFFMIAKYVEDTRRLAISSSVKTVEGSRFGFKQYENVGPSKEDITRVHRQTKIMEALLQALFDSGIGELVSIKREGSEEAQPQLKGRSDSTSNGELFSLEGDGLVRRADSFDSLAFRLEFKGQSLAMRGFLNRITGSSLPFSVHEVDVRLERESGSDEGRSAIIDNPFLSEENSNVQSRAVQVPIISENESHFGVTLEFLELIDSGVLTEVEREGKGSGDV